MVGLCNGDSFHCWFARIQCVFGLHTEFLLLSFWRKQLPQQYHIWCVIPVWSYQYLFRFMPFHWVIVIYIAEIVLSITAIGNGDWQVQDKSQCNCPWLALGRWVSAFGGEGEGREVHDGCDATSEMARPQEWSCFHCIVLGGRWVPLHDWHYDLRRWSPIHCEASHTIIYLTEACQCCLTCILFLKSEL